MRAYFFGNMYLSSIQQGIQAAHAVAEMFGAYRPNSDEHNQLLEWACNHKTMILLNAGYSSAIAELCELFETDYNPYPWAHFNESDEALDGALTTVGIVLPEMIYESSAFLRSISRQSMVELIEIAYDTGNLDVTAENGDSCTSYDVTKFQMDLIVKLNNFGLAK